MLMKRKIMDAGAAGGPGHLVRVSKEMSRILRHAPPASMDASGWVDLPELLQHLRKSKASEADVRAVVEVNDKKRFVLDDGRTPARIRAAQGHSVVLEAPVLLPVVDAATVPVALHITGREGWVAIQESGELRRMARSHIHFATQPHMLRKNSWATTLLQLDVQAAMDAGHELLLSSNDVLLCVGPLPVSLVREVQPIDLPETWREAIAATPAAGRGAAKRAGASAQQEVVKPAA